MQSSEVQTPEGSKAVVQIENLLERTERQLTMLGRMLNTVSELAEDNKSLSEGTERPPELKKKAEDSALRILHQIDNLIEDMPRWGSAPSAMEKHYTDLLKATAEMQRAKAFEAQIKSLPSSRHPLHLHEYSEGRWGAYLVQHGEARLLGSGRSPQEAINAFDRNFIEPEEAEKVENKPRQTKKKPLKSKDGPKNIQSTGAA